MTTRTSRGTCRICGKSATRVGMTRHLAACWPKMRGDDGPSRALFHLRVEPERDPYHWLHLQVAGDALLLELDDVLRRIWLECCGHMSSFDVPRRLRGDPWLRRRGIDPCGELDLDLPVSAAFELTDRIGHSYDFGSTTRLSLRCVGQRVAPLGAVGKIRILARNEPPAWTCHVCGEPASLIDREYPPRLYCEEHARTHGGEQEMLLPVVDSPRMGVCGYGGPSVEPATDPGTSQRARRTGGEDAGEAGAC